MERLIMNKRLAVFLFAICLAVCLAASSSSTETTEDTASSIVSTDLFKSHEASINVYPYAFYSPEVKLAFGAGGIITFYTSEDKSLKPSKASVSGYYSTSKQYRVGLSPQVYLLGNRVFASLKLFIQDKTVFTPDPVYPEVDAQVYGIKTELRIPALFGFNTKDKRRKLGFTFDYQHVEVRYDDVDTGEEDVATDGPPHTLGLGCAWIFDSRDNIFYPISGHLRLFKVAVFAKDFGSSYDFNRFEIDVRQYFPINPERRQLIAAQLYVDIARGAPPFYRLPALGGSRIMRGYKSGTLRDRNYIAGQVEFRTHAGRRFGAVAFLGAGDVANEVGDFKLGELEYSYGVGLRYIFNKKEGINLRADLGFGENTNGFYISVEEAF
jgi:outer membrane protein assembly factor BamA